MASSASDYPPVTSGVADDIKFSFDDEFFSELSLVDVMVFESILSPDPQITMTLHDANQITKNMIDWKLKDDKPIKLKEMKLVNPFADYNTRQDGMGAQNVKDITIKDQIVYRVDQGKLVNYYTEEFKVHICSPLTIENMKTRISKFYPKNDISKVVEDALKSVCEKSGIKFDVESTEMKRDYISNNMHPYQIVSEIVDMATKNGWTNYFHFATFEDKKGKHYVKSLKKLIEGSSKITYRYEHKGVGDALTKFDNILSYEFPSFFDTLLDLSHGIIDDENLEIEPSMVSLNPFTSTFYIVDGDSNGNQGKPIGGTLNSGAWSNHSTMYDVPNHCEKYLHTRTGPLAFENKNRPDIKIIVPFNPELHAGEVIKIELDMILEGNKYKKNYGTGDYLVSTLTHNIKTGSYGVTVIEAIYIKESSGSPPDTRLKHQKIKYYTEKNSN